MSDRALEGRRILLIEDEYLIATDLVTALENAGAVVFGPVSDLERAMEIVGGRFLLDGAVLDVNLHGEMVYPAAKVLSGYSVPILSVTGYECRSLPEPFTSNPCLAKPFNERDLIDALTMIVRTAA